MSVKMTVDGKLDNLMTKVAAVVKTDEIMSG